MATFPQFWRALFPFLQREPQDPDVPGQPKATNRKKAEKLDDVGPDSPSRPDSNEELKARARATEARVSEKSS